MSVLLIAGSPAQRSRSNALLDGVADRLRSQGVLSEYLRISHLPAEALLRADTAHPQIQEAIAAVAQAQTIVVATPVYKAAYSGVLKVFLDLLPQDALIGKTVLPVVTGGSAHHMLVLDYALRPVLQALAAGRVLQGVYATDSEITLLPEGGHVLHAAIAHRLDNAVTAIGVDGSHAFTVKRAPRLVEVNSA